MSTLISKGFIFIVLNMHIYHDENN